MAPLQIEVTKPSPPAPVAPENAPDLTADGTPSARGPDIAVLEINGQLYRDWETIQVRVTKEEQPYRSFRFTCSEGMPLVNNFAALRIRPGDRCQVTLAGEPVVYGFVNTRQVYYDASQHHIEIQGCSADVGLANASAISKTMEYKNVTFEQYARALLKPFIPAISFIPKGTLPQTKFPRISIAHGTSILEALEIPLRSLGGVQLSANFKGDILAYASDAPPEGMDTVVEGKNILEGREIIYSQAMAKDGIEIGQFTGSDQKRGAAVSHSLFSSIAIGLLPGQYRPHVNPMDMPAASDDHLKGRGHMERDLMVMDEVTVFITLQGWQRPSGGLWKGHQRVSVKSPMLIMDGSEELWTRSVTFTQDNQRGTRTVLELVNKKGLAPDKPAGDVPESRSDSSSTDGAPGQGGIGHA